MNRSRRSMTPGGGKRYLIFFFCVIFVFLFVSCTNRYIIWWPPVNPDSDEEPITEDIWDGTVADYSVILNQIDSGEVRIGSAAEFAAFRDLVNGKDPNYTDGFLGINVFLDIDLDMTNQDWEPIGLLGFIDGNNIDICPFLGIFDGNNHTIKYKYDGTGEGLNAYGLFAVTYGLNDPVIIKNLRIEATVPNLSGLYFGAGLIVGTSFEEIQFENCHVLSGSSLCIEGGTWGYAGGFIGYVNNGASFTDCVNEADITADNYAGGFAGEIFTTNQDYSDIACEFNNCQNTGDITSKESFAGGLVASVDRSDGGTIKYIGCSNFGSISAGNCAGGIVGNNYGTIDEMSNCSGGIMQISGTEGAGRIIGRIYSHSPNNDVSIISIDDANDDSYDSIGTIGQLSNSNATLRILSGTLRGVPDIVDDDWIIYIAEGANWIGNGVPENPSGKTFTLSLVNGNVTITEKQ